MFEVDTAELLREVDELEQIYNNMARSRERLSNCVADINSRWTSIGATDHDTYIKNLNSDLERLANLISALSRFGSYLSYMAYEYARTASND